MLAALSREVGLKLAPGPEESPTVFADDVGVGPNVFRDAQLDCATERAFELMV